jgi:hypothetical protein
VQKVLRATAGMRQESILSGFAKLTSLQRA